MFEGGPKNVENKPKFYFFMQLIPFERKIKQKEPEGIKQMQTHLHFWTMMIYTVSMMILFMGHFPHHQI